MSRLIELLKSAHGQCRLVWVSATSLKLIPYGGRNLCINGLPEQVPAAGITVSNSGLGVNTFYYVYAYMNAGVMALELSTTGHSTNNGIETKTGDTTRTLVGAVATNASSQFQDSSGVLGVLSWFNRRKRVTSAWFTAARSLSATSATEFSSEIRIYFISWAEELVTARANGGIWSGTAGPGYAYIGVDTVSQSDSGGGANTSSTQVPFSAQWDLSVSEGAAHFATIYGFAASGGTINLSGNATQAAGQRTNLTVAVMG